MLRKTRIFGLKCFLLLVLLLVCIPCLHPQGGFFWRASVYQDWMGLKIEDTEELYSRLSSRLKLTCWNKPGNGWTIHLDVRNRLTLDDYGKNRLIIYDARISYDRPKSRFFASLGQMNLYDTAGIGELTGGTLGIKMSKYLSLGGYAGLAPDIYDTRWDTAYTRAGVFVRYLGPRAGQFTLSFNRLTYDGKTERQFLYSSLLLPVQRFFILYGSLEYEADNITRAEDRLSRLFLNARADLSRFIDVTATYSSGRGLDYHRFLLEQSQNPTMGETNEIERFYYNKMAGARLSLKPFKHLRLYVERRESEAADRGIKNHTTRFGFSLARILANIVKSGLYAYGNYSLNRGDASESDSYYLSASGTFGRLSCGLSFANYYNGVRISGEGAPTIFHLPDRHTLSANAIFTLNPSLVLALDYAYSAQKDNPEHRMFVRVIYRKR